jgi:hypothetical protein
MQAVGYLWTSSCSLGYANTDGLMLTDNITTVYLMRQFMALVDALGDIGIEKAVYLRMLFPTDVAVTQRLSSSTCNLGTNPRPLQ